jgi:hypothetical protein
VGGSKSRSTLNLLAGADDSVYVGKYRGRKVAISEFREHLSESMSLITRLSEADEVVDIRELKLLSEFSHPNIVKFVSHPISIRFILNGSAVSVSPEIIAKSHVCSLASYVRMVICLIIS